MKYFFVTWMFFLILQWCLWNKCITFEDSKKISKQVIFCFYFFTSFPVLIKKKNMDISVLWWKIFILKLQKEGSYKIFVFCKKIIFQVLINWKKWRIPKCLIFILLILFPGFPTGTWCLYACKKLLWLERIFESCSLLKAEWIYQQCHLLLVYVCKISSWWEKEVI